MYTSGLVKSRKDLCFKVMPLVSALMDGSSANCLAELPSYWPCAPQAFVLGIDDIGREGSASNGWEAAVGFMSALSYP